jgi:hypothetical protein
VVSVIGIQVLVLRWQENTKNETSKKETFLKLQNYHQILNNLHLIKFSYQACLFELLVHIINETLVFQDEGLVMLHLPLHDFSMKDLVLFMNFLRTTEHIQH